MDPISLKSSNHNSSLINSLDHFKAVNSFVDVTLVCEGHTVKAHKIILSAGSNVLHSLLLANPVNHPILIFAETKYDTLRIIIDFLYKGRVDIPRNDLHKVLQVATTFEINDLKKLCEESLNNENSDNEPNMHPCLNSPVLSESSPKKKRQRRQSFDSDILIPNIVPKTEPNLSPCRLEQPEVTLLTDTLSVIAQTELVEFHPQISDSSSVLITSIESSTGSNSTGSSVQQIQKRASTECDIQLQKKVKCKCVPYKPARVLMKPTFSEITDCGTADSSETSSQDLTHQTTADCVTTDSSETSSQELTNQTEFQAMVLKEVKVIKSLCRRNQEMIDSMFTSMNNIDMGGNIEKKQQRMKLRTDLPLKTMEQMDSLEQELEQNPEAINQLTHQLNIVGGINFENMVRRILRTLMEDCLAAQFSWLGSKGKRSFASLHSMKCVFGAVRSNLTFGQKQDSEIEIIIRNWLRHAPGRCKHVMIVANIE